jgi:hypothetical protein
MDAIVPKVIETGREYDRQQALYKPSPGKYCWVSQTAKGVLVSDYPNCQWMDSGFDRQ